MARYELTETVGRYVTYSYIIEAESEDDAWEAWTAAGEEVDVKIGEIITDIEPERDVARLD